MNKHDSPWGRTYYPYRHHLVVAASTVRRMIAALRSGFVVVCKQAGMRVWSFLF